VTKGGERSERKRIEEILGVKAEVFSDGGVVKVSFPRTEVAVTIDSRCMRPFMGLTSWASFQKGTRNGVEVMVIHNHMTFEELRYIFIHYWGMGTAADLAHSLKSALDKTHESKLQSFQENNSRENVDSKCDHCD